jgi:hypothetical protein
MYCKFSTNTHTSIAGIKNKHTALEGREDQNKNRKHCEQP